MRRQERGFTLIELIAVIAIVAIVASLLFPAISAMQTRAESTKCMSNLRQVGIALLLAAAENENRFPYIESDPEKPTYPPEYNAKSLLATLRPYGLNEQNVQCPTDLKGANYFARKGASYEWRPYMDGESIANPAFYKPSGAWPVPPSRVRIATDYERIHNDGINMLYADGHVRGFDR